MKEPGRKSLTLKQMTRGAYYFQAALPAGGFAWRRDLKVPPRDERGCLPDTAFTRPWLVGPYRQGIEEAQFSVLNPPQGHPGIHREIASLWSEESILEFANTYGHLLPPEEMAPLSDFAPGETIRSGTPASSIESLAQWRTEIETLRRLLYFWDLVKDGDLEALADFVAWEPWDSPPDIYDVLIGWHETPNAPPGPYRDSLTIPGPYPGRFQRVLLNNSAGGARLVKDFAPFDVLEPMRAYVQMEVNMRLWGSVSPCGLLHAPASHRIAFIPDSLRATAYVLFLLELTGEFETAQCRYDKCTKPGRRFVQNTARQEYCSDYCRKAAHDQYRRKGARNGEA